MYRTVIKLDKRKNKKEIADRNMMHKFVLRFFEGGRAEANVLFQVIEEADFYIVIQSNNKPENLKNIDVERIEKIDDGIASVQAGDILQFTGELACMKKRDGKEIRPSGTAERLAWTAEKAEKNGFTIITYYSLEPSNAKMMRKKEVHIPSSIYKGVLQVTDADKFRKILKNGIGTYKAFGCGMLTVRG